MSKQDPELGTDESASDVIVDSQVTEDAEAKRASKGMPITRLILLAIPTIALGVMASILISNYQDRLERERRIEEARIRSFDFEGTEEPLSTPALAAEMVGDAVDPNAPANP